MSGQGLCKNFDKDAWPVRHCVSLGLEVMCAQTFCHTFGLYGKKMKLPHLLNLRVSAKYGTHICRFTNMNFFVG